MFSKIQINKSTENYSQQIEQIREKLNNADAVVIGAGAGLSTSAGFTYSGERFYKHFSDFAEKYGIHARHLYERLGFHQLGVIPKGFRMKDGHYENICPYFIEL